MKINKKQQKAVTRFESFVERLATLLSRKAQPFIIALLLGVPLRNG